MTEETTEKNPRYDICSSVRKVQVGRMVAIDVKCAVERWAHDDEVHTSSRQFGDVTMIARWRGPFEEA